MKTSGPLSEQSNLSSAGDQTGGSIRESVPEQPYESKAQSQCPEIRSKASKGISTKYKTRQAKETSKHSSRESGPMTRQMVTRLLPLTNRLGMNGFFCSCDPVRRPVGSEWYGSRVVGFQDYRAQ
ncbi:hypothetical protein TKK_0012447 [Trichogramma kaykai]